MRELVSNDNYADSLVAYLLEIRTTDDIERAEKVIIPACFKAGLIIGKGAYDDLIERARSLGTLEGYMRLFPFIVNQGERSAAYGVCFSLLEEARKNDFLPVEVLEEYRRTLKQKDNRYAVIPENDDRLFHLTGLFNDWLRDDADVSAGRFGADCKECGGRMSRYNANNCESVDHRYSAVCHKHALRQTSKNEVGYAIRNIILKQNVKWRCGPCEQLLLHSDPKEFRCPDRLHLVLFKANHVARQLKYQKGARLARGRA